MFLSGIQRIDHGTLRCAYLFLKCHSRRADNERFGTEQTGCAGGEAGDSVRIEGQRSFEILLAHRELPLSTLDLDRK